jgi:hypothetical protein
LVFAYRQQGLLRSTDVIKNGLREWISDQSLHRWEPCHFQ